MPCNPKYLNHDKYHPNKTVVVQSEIIFNVNRPLSKANGISHLIYPYLNTPF